MKALLNKFANWLKRQTCTHNHIGEGWIVQGVRFRHCDDCGETEVEKAGCEMDYKHPFTKLVNNKYTNQRYRGE